MILLFRGFRKNLRPHEADHAATAPPTGSEQVALQRAQLSLHFCKKSLWVFSFGLCSRLCVFRWVIPLPAIPRYLRFSLNYQGQIQPHFTVRKVAPVLGAISLNKGKRLKQSPTLMSEAEITPVGEFCCEDIGKSLDSIHFCPIIRIPARHLKYWPCCLLRLHFQSGQTMALFSSC